MNLAKVSLNLNLKIQFYLPISTMPWYSNSNLQIKGRIQNHRGPLDEAKISLYFSVKYVNVKIKVILKVEVGPPNYLLYSES